MQKFLSYIIVSFMVVFSVGCAAGLGEKPTATPSDKRSDTPKCNRLKNPENRAACRCSDVAYDGERFEGCMTEQREVARLEEKMRPDASDPPASPAKPQGAQIPPELSQLNPAGALMAPVPVMLTYAPQGDGGCLPGNNLSIRNKGSYYLEVRGDNLRPCGSGNLTAITVSQPNGAPRVAMVVPPGAKGLFYFYPHRDANGIPVPIASVQDYEVGFYRSGGLYGLQPATPSKKDYLCRWSHDTRIVVATGGVWGVVEVFSDTPRNNLTSCRAV